MNRHHVTAQEKSQIELARSVDLAEEALLRVTLDAMRHVPVTASAARRMNLANRELEHWQRQQAYQGIRATWPTAEVVHADLSQPDTCRIIAMWDEKREPVSLTDPARISALADVGKALRASIYNSDPSDINGWTRSATSQHIFHIHLPANPPALTLDLGQPDSSGRYPPPHGIATVVSDLCDGFLHSIRATLAEYARALVEGWHPPVTDPTQWTSVAAVLGHPVDPNAQLWIGDIDVTDEDWQHSIIALHSLADGVLCNDSTGETHGQEGPLHQWLVLGDDLLTTHSLTMGELANAFDHDPRLAAVAVLRAFVNDRFAGIHIKN